MKASVVSALLGLAAAAPPLIFFSCAAVSHETHAARGLVAHQLPMLLLLLSTITPVVHAAPIVHRATAYDEPTYVDEPYTHQHGLANDYSKANFNAAETADANGAVSRSYNVDLPDSRNQHVKYTFDNYKGYVTDTTMLEIHSPLPSNKLRL